MSDHALSLATRVQERNSWKNRFPTEKVLPGLAFSIFTPPALIGWMLLVE
jgi:hypothetical protein